MSNAGTAELYFIAIMMLLILIISFTATYIFFRQYKREMKLKEEAKFSKANRVKDDEEVNAETK